MTYWNTWNTKNGKAVGLSRTAAEMLKAAPATSCKIIADLMNAIILEGKVPWDWSDITLLVYLKEKEMR